MTYAKLLVSLLAWTRKPEAEQQFPTFIALAEAQISRKLSEAGVLGSQVRADALLDDEYVAAPDDIAVPLILTLSTGEVVENATLDSLDALKASYPTRTGKPCHYALIGAELRLYPVPDASYAAELVYQQRLACIGPTIASNWVLDEHPDVYLYGALVQAAQMLADDRLSAWSTLYTTAMDDLIKSERSKRGSRNTPGFRVDPALRQRQTFNIVRGF